MLRHRLVTAIVGIPLALALTYAGGWYLTLGIASLAIAGLREIYRLLAARDRLPYSWLGYPLGLLVLAAATTASDALIAQTLLVEMALLAIALGIVVSWMLADRVGSRGVRLFATFASHLYVPQLLSYVIRLRGVSQGDITPSGLGFALPVGACWVILLLFAVWAMDTAAYAVGRAGGRIKLWPAVSPGKTVEGSLAGFIASIAVAGALGAWFGIALPKGLVFGAVVGLFGQAGDLIESALKRRAGVKDSGWVLPGHGGVLDRLDSLLFTAPVAYYYFALSAAV